MAKFTLHTNNGISYQFDDNDEIHRGGEGRILSIKTDKNLVAKIYHAGIKPITFDKFTFLSQLDADLFVVPYQLLLDSANTIVGFTMQYLGKEYIPFATIFSKNFCARNSISLQSVS